MKEQDYKTTALSRLTDRHRSDETFLAILDTLVEIKSQRQQQYLDIADTFLDIDKSEGKNLDLIGKLIGEERTLVNFIDRAYFGFLGARLSESYDIGYWYSLYKNKYGTLRTLTDAEYRRVLKARVVKNSSDNNRNSFIEVLNILSGNNNSSVIESQNNTAITVNVEDVDGLVSYYLSKYKSDRNLIPVPLGRRLNVNHITPNNGGGNEIPSNEIYFTTLEGEVGYTGTELDQILLSDGTIVDIPVTSQTYSFNVPAGTHKVILVESVDRDNSVTISGEALVELHNFPTLSTVTHFSFHIGESPPSDNLIKVPNFLPSNITDISYMFAWAGSFNQDISGWNVSNVTNMSGMFEGAGSFNQPLNDWDVSNVTYMYSMFYHARSFNQDLSQWCVSQIPIKPNNFDSGATNWTLPRPVWGTCPA